MRNENVKIPILGSILLRARYKKVLEKKGTKFNLRSRTRKKSIYK